MSYCNQQVYRRTGNTPYCHMSLYFPASPEIMNNDDDNNDNNNNNNNNNDNNNEGVLSFREKSRLRCLTRRSKVSHRCLIGLRSGDYEGHSI